jgi:putative tricarboxylic transport membrane protein
MNKLLLAALISGALSTTAFAADYNIMAPAAPGGGWDQTARTMQEALVSEGISGNVQVTNVPGAGGTIGLAQFATQNAGNPNALIVGGYVMVGAILTNASPVTLDNVTPIARLTGEAVGVVVPASSSIQTMDDLVAQLQENPGGVSWAGGSAGGADHITAGLIAQAVDVDPTQVNYIAYSGGGEALAAILGGQVTVGVSGISEFASQIEAGSRLRCSDAPGSRCRHRRPELAHGCRCPRHHRGAKGRDHRRHPGHGAIRRLAGRARKPRLGGYLS